jgi:hypothetical protein
VRVDAGEHADSFLVDFTREAPTPRAQRMHLVAVATGAPIRRQPPETSANVTGGHSLEKPLQNATGSKTSSLAGDAREHPAIDDEATEVHQVQDV